MRIKKEISILNITEEKSALSQHVKENDGMDIAISSMPYIRYFLSSYCVKDVDKKNKSDVIKESNYSLSNLLKYTMTISLIDRNRLNEQEREKFCFLRKHNFLNDKLERTSEYNEKLEVLFNNVVNDVKSIIKGFVLTKSYSHYEKSTKQNLNHLNKGWLPEDLPYNDLTLLKCAKFLRDVFLKENSKEIFFNHINIEVNKLLDLSVLNIEATEIYLLEITPTMEEIIKTGSLYKIERYDLIDKSMGANGEHLTFLKENCENDNENNLDNKLVIANGYYQNGRSIFMNGDKELFFTKEEAEKVGISNVKRIKEIIDRYDVVKF